MTYNDEAMRRELLRLEPEAMAMIGYRRTKLPSWKAEGNRIIVDGEGRFTAEEIADIRYAKLYNAYVESDRAYRQLMMAFWVMVVACIALVALVVAMSYRGYP